jgi:hypothetical protein
VRSATWASSASVSLGFAGALTGRYVRQKLVIEVMLQFRAMLDYCSRSLLQLALRSFEE